jgi:hypothetical protein
MDVYRIFLSVQYKPSFLNVIPNFNTFINLSIIQLVYLAHRIVMCEPHSWSYSTMEIHESYGHFTQARTTYRNNT